jgi:hypothetical protein
MKKRETSETYKRDQSLQKEPRYHVVGYEAQVNEDVADNRRKIVDKVEETITNPANRDKIANIIEIEKKSVFRLRETGYVEAFDQLGKLEDKIRANKNIDWHTIKAYTVKNEILAESLKDIQKCIHDLNKYDNKLVNLPIDTVRQLRRAKHASQDAITKEFPTYKKHNSIITNIDQILLKCEKVNAIARGMITTRRQEKGIISDLSTTEALYELDRLKDEINSKNLEIAVQYIKSHLGLDKTKGLE